VKQSGIGWCDFSGGNLNVVVRGSTPGDCECGPGCVNCYVKAIDDRFHFLPERTTWYPEKLKKLATMKFPEFSPKRGAPHRPMCFVCGTGDLFHEDVPRTFILNALAQMEWVRDDVTWQILTKRPERARELIRARSEELRALPSHIWLGVSISNQRTVDERIPILLDIPAAVRWVSIEPMLEAVNLLSCIMPDDEDWDRVNEIDDNSEPREFIEECEAECDWINYGRDLVPNPEHLLWQQWRRNQARAFALGRQLDWVVAGAESGPNRRSFDVAWVADILRQCQAAGVACFLKQDSGLYPGKPLMVDGKEWKEWPT